MIKRIIYYLPLFIVGGAIYNMIEIAFRGYTHITMFFAGGLCLALIGFTDRKLDIPFWVKMLVSGGIITAVEFVFGVVFNCVFRLGVWDYSMYPGNVMGQICPLFSLMWVFLSVPAILLARLWGRGAKKTEEALCMRIEGFK